jgi:hypothetical protein
MRRLLLTAGMLAAASAPGQGQTALAPDTSFQVSVSRPAYQPQRGPRVCIDEGHNNGHTSTGKHRPFADLLRADGYRVTPLAEPFAAPALADCGVLVIATPQAAENVGMEQWRYPHFPAFTADEVDALILWVHNGGALLLFPDHAPFAGASAALGAVFGALLAEAWSYATPRGIMPEIFRRGDGTVLSHPIMEGRDSTERIDSIATFVAGAFHAAEQVRPFLVLSDSARAWVMLGEMGQRLAGLAEDSNPEFRMRGWAVGGAARWGQGRVVIVGDATACTAQRYGRARVHVGMNHPAAAQNAQFCLNVVRWLDGLLDPAP